MTPNGHSCVNSTLGLGPLSDVERRTDRLLTGGNKLRRELITSVLMVTCGVVLLTQYLIFWAQKRITVFGTVGGTLFGLGFIVWGALSESKTLLSTVGMLLVIIGSLIMVRDRANVSKRLEKEP